MIYLCMFNKSDEDLSLSSPLVITRIINQLIIWKSLYFFTTNKGRFQPGTFVLLSALKVISYMGVVGFACFYIVQKSTEREEGLTSVIGKFSILYILAGLAVLLSLIYHQGCVPNTKPLLDYSDLVKV